MTITNIANPRNTSWNLQGTTGDAYRFKKITYPGINNKSEFTYSPTGGRAKIVETVSGSVTSTKQLVGGEERDGSGAVTKRFFSLGFKDGSTSLFYDRDHLGSVRTLTDDSGVVQAAYNFDPFGRTTKLEGPEDSDFGFAGMYVHARSGLNLTAVRAYDARLGIWLSRDPVAAAASYSYVAGSPTNLIDPLGLDYQAPPYFTDPQNAADDIIIQQIFDQTIKDFNKEIKKRKGLWGLWYTAELCAGNLIDREFKKRISQDKRLTHLRVTPQGQRGPDVWDPNPNRRAWWDVTTPLSWEAHVDKYSEDFGPHGTELLYQMEFKLKTNFF